MGTDGHLVNMREHTLALLKSAGAVIVLLDMCLVQDDTFLTASNIVPALEIRTCEPADSRHNEQARSPMICD